jgi:D-amino peptidase
MQGIDATFDGIILLGYHAGTTNPEGVRAHTISSARLADVKLNGRSLSEAGIAAAVAGHFGVPVIMVSGDDAAVAEVQATLGTIEGAAVKWHYGFHSARTLTPAATYKLIAEKAAAAVRRLRAREFKPFVLSTPVTVDLRFKHYRPAEVLAYLPSIQRPDAHSVRYLAKTVLEAMQFLSFVEEYNFELEP